MTGGRRGPWLASVGLHIVIGAVLILLLPQPSPQSPLRMRFIASAAPRTAQTAAKTMSAPVLRPPASVEPGLPGWQSVSPSSVSVPVGQVPVSLNDLLVAVEPKEAETVGTWGADGVGYVPPPLPPPQLAPPQGARWDLVIAVPAGGGFASSLEGLDSGHPELDRWLEEYLRTVSFPSSPDGKEYQARWRLRLESGKPR